MERERKARNKRMAGRGQGSPYKNSKPQQRMLSGFPLWVGDELLSHV